MKIDKKVLFYYLTWYVDYNVKAAYKLINLQHETVTWQNKNVFYCHVNKYHK